jgi:hypothetical protein
MPVPPAMSADIENLCACHRISQLAPVNTDSAIWLSMLACQGRAGPGMRPGRLAARQWSCQPRRLADTSPLAVAALAAGV